MKFNYIFFSNRERQTMKPMKFSRYLFLVLIGGYVLPNEINKLIFQVTYYYNPLISKYVYNYVI